MKDLRLTRQGDTQWILWDGPEMVAYVLDRDGTVVVNMVEEEEKEDPFFDELDAVQAEVEAEQAEHDRCYADERGEACYGADENCRPEYLLEATCPTCSAENGPRGVLGRTVHYRCRACGLGYSLHLTEAAYETYAAGWEGTDDADDYGPGSPLYCAGPLSDTGEAE